MDKIEQKILKSLKEEFDKWTWKAPGWLLSPNGQFLITINVSFRNDGKFCNGSYRENDRVKSHIKKASQEVLEFVSVKFIEERDRNIRKGNKEADKKLAELVG